MADAIHGTINDPKRNHPVFDMRHWEVVTPPRMHPNGFSPGDVDNPEDVVLTEWARAEARKKGDLGPSVKSDIFVWSSDLDPDKPWLTRIGGTPWRPKDRPWPTAENGRPLMFLGQICFVDSKDLLTHQLPGAVALIYGAYGHGSCWLHEGHALEWSPLRIKEPLSFVNVPWGCQLPVQYQGVIHRTVQYTEHRVYDEKFEACGWKSGGFNIASVQATSIGKYCDLPQGWPFKKGDGNRLICTLSSLSVSWNPWPCVDVPHCPQVVNPSGRAIEWSSLSSTLGFQVGDAGAIWIYRDKHGKFHLDEACG